MKRLSVAFLLLASLATGIANAVPVTITATGEVFNSRDDFNLFGLGTARDTILGATITQVYTFDTDDIPNADADPAIDVADYRDGSDWLSATTFVDTLTIDTVLEPSTIAALDTFRDQVIINDGELVSTDHEEIGIQDLDRRASPFEQLVQHIHFFDSNAVDNNITSFDPIAALNLMDPALWENARGLVEYRDDSSARSHAIFLLSSVDIAYASVPEPTALTLMAAGLFGLGFMRLHRAGR